MKRRDFLKASVPATVLPFMLGGLSIKAFGRNPLLDQLTANCNGNVLVVIQLSGGNDGLNTVIPFDQYPALMNARSNIVIPQSSALALTSSLGLNPQMTGMQSMFKNGQLAIVQSVGYPTPNFSHFRSTDIWLTGSDSYQTLVSGWMGRFLDQEYPGYPTGYPSVAMPDPLAVQIGSSVTTGLEGPNANMGIAFSSASAFYDIVDSKVPAAPNTRYGQELTYIRQVGQQLENFSAPVKNASAKGTTKSKLWPSAKTSPLADQLKIVASMIAGGLKTPLYVVNLTGFDTHSGQRAAQDLLLGQLSTAIQAFQDELTLNAAQDRVLGMTFSEFGRRILSNSSGGTDHGAAAPLFVFGSQVKGGILGKNPTLPLNATVDDNVDMQYDFRSVYASIIKEWFCADDTVVAATLGQTFPILPLVQGSSAVADPNIPVNFALYQNYPNPFNPSTKIVFTSPEGHVSLKVFDIEGREVRTLVDRQLQAGEHDILFDASGLGSGTYLYKLRAGTAEQMKTMVLTK